MPIVTRHTNNLNLFIEYSHQVDKRKFREQDLAIFESDVAVDKITEGFQKSPYKFNVCILTGTELNINNGHLRARQLGFKPQADALNSIILNNINSDANYVPFTKWITVHRVVHTFEFFGYFENAHRDLNVLANNHVCEFVDQLCGRVAYPVKEITNNTSGRLVFNTRERWVIQYLMTMRSARLGRVTTADVFAELLTQYIVTGKVTLARWPDWYERLTLPVNTFPEKSISWSPDIYEMAGWQVRNLIVKALDFGIYDELDAMVEDLETKLNATMRQIMNIYVGQECVF